MKIVAIVVVVVVSLILHSNDDSVKSLLWLLQQKYCGFCVVFDVIIVAVTVTVTVAAAAIADRYRRFMRTKVRCDAMRQQRYNMIQT